MDSQLSIIKSSTFWKFAISLTVAPFALYQGYLRIKYSNGKKISTKMGEQNNTTWCSNSGFAVFSAIVDAFIPSYTVNECSDEEILKVLKSISPLLPLENLATNVSDISKFRSFLCAGAIQYGTHKHAAEALENVCTKENKQQLSTILSLLSTSVGSLLLTGMLIPFQNLPLHAREQVIRSWRDSNFEALRGLYQVSYLSILLIL